MLPCGFYMSSSLQLPQNSLLFLHISGLIAAFFPLLFQSSLLFPGPPASALSSLFSLLLRHSQDSLLTDVQEAMWLLFCSASFLSTSASVLSFSAFSRILSSVFSFSRLSEVSASSCSRLTASPS